MRYSENIRQQVAADIRSQLPVGVFNITIKQAALILGCSAGHIRNQISDKVFPIQTVPIGSRRLIPLTNLIDYQCGLMFQGVTPGKRRRGPRTKAERRLQAQAVEAQGGAA